MFGQPQLSPVHQANNVTNTGIVLKDKNVRVKLAGSSPNKRNASLVVPRGRISDNPIDDIVSGRDWNLNYAIDGIQYTAGATADRVHSLTHSINNESRNFHTELDREKAQGDMDDSEIQKFAK